MRRPSVTLCFFLVSSLTQLVACRTTTSSLKGDEGAVLDTCDAGWEVFSSAPYAQVALPDMNANYWRLRFKYPVNKGAVLKVSGSYAAGRYMNFNVYRQDTLDSLLSVADLDIQPDPGAQNPFTRAGRDPAIGGTYTLWIGQADGLEEIAAGHPNRLALPALPGAVGSDKDASQVPLELWYRVYLADQAEPILPKVELVDPTTTQPTCLLSYHVDLPPTGALKGLPPKSENGDLRFFHPTPSALYANQDNQYLSARLNFDLGDVAVVRFKAPTSPGHLALGGAAPAVRYWSMCWAAIRLGPQAASMTASRPWMRMAT